MTIQELMEKRAKAWDTARDFLDSKRNSSGLLSEEDSKAYDKMEAEIVALDKEISRLEKLSELDAEMNKPASSPILGKPSAPEMKPDKTGTASDSYKTAFWNSVRNRNFMDFQNALQVGTDSEGGYLVPDEFEKKLIEALTEENIFRPLATVIKTSSGDRKIPIVTSKGEAVWIDEESSYTLSDDVFGQASLSAYKVGTAIKISEELLNDSAFDLPAYITKEFSRRVGTKEEEAFIIGNGTGKPTGIFAATGGGQVAGTLSGAVKTDDVIDLVYALKRPYRKNAVFIMNDKTLASLRKLKDNNGAYLWQPSYQAGEPDKVLGYTVYTSAYAPENAVAFGDFKYYNIGDRGTRSFKQLNELFAGNGMIGFVAKERVDGKLVLPEAVQIMKLS